MDPEDPFFHSPSTSRLAIKRSPHREAHPSSTPPPFVPPTIILPLRTPVKDSHKKPFLLSVDECVESPVGIGTKRKPAPLTFNTATPLRKRSTTPLQTAATAQVSSRLPTGSVAFECLAPLTAPRFPARTPQTKAETDLALRRQAETMKKLKICDLDMSGDESDTEASDKPLLFLKREDEIATNVSPDGRITKRRVRSRPISSELLEDAADSPFLVKVFHAQFD
jgi:mitosis inhibitor protein kinase SWE1